MMCGTVVEIFSSNKSARKSMESFMQKSKLKKASWDILFDIDILSYPLVINWKKHM
jgi:hypothetical protein